MIEERSHQIGAGGLTSQLWRLWTLSKVKHTKVETSCLDVVFCFRQSTVLLWLLVVLGIEPAQSFTHESHLQNHYSVSPGHGTLLNTL